MAKTVAYLRVSTAEQDLNKNKGDILFFCNEKRFGDVDFVEEKVSGKKPWKERKIKTTIDQLGPGDRLIVPEFSRLGRSMLEIMEIIVFMVRKNVTLPASIFFRRILSNGRR
jgi:DNA invertase Pin-like site-specific DNA recombinase